MRSETMRRHSLEAWKGTEGSQRTEEGEERARLLPGPGLRLRLTLWAVYSRLLCVHPELSTLRKGQCPHYGLVLLTPDSTKARAFLPMGMHELFCSLFLLPVRNSLSQPEAQEE